MLSHAVAPPFAKVLIANRGEIAVRVIRACREMGIATVAVFSEADREALHVLQADEAVAIGPAPPAESYLNQDRIIAAARATGAQAIHPGYGFLAENAAFAEACAAAGLVFIGPPPAAVRAMGDKMAARRVAIKLGVPLVPGTSEPLADGAEAARVAREIGYPVMIKAAMGGGGKGMRLVHAYAELEGALRAARSEAGSAFGDASVYIERYVAAPRHVEVQILADAHGTVVHLGERECSIQRRHQKLVEETPSVAVDPDLRQRMWAAAVAGAKASGYQNAGTVEFLVDAEKNFYFLEVNARLQVEHPVTEACTGLDLVAEQIRVAAGDKLSFSQDDIQPRGHAIECRISAEDPYNNFLPSLGHIDWVDEPSGPGVRVDSSLFSGIEVPYHYDPMLAKVICWGPTRDIAVQRMLRALREYVVVGIQTNIPFHLQLLTDERFLRGEFHTGFLETEFTLAPLDGHPDEQTALLAAALLVHLKKRQPLKIESGAADASGWGAAGRERLVQRSVRRGWQRTG